MGSSYTGSSVLAADVSVPFFPECSLACSYSVDSLRGGLLTVTSSFLLRRWRITKMTTTATIISTSKTEPTAMPLMAAVLRPSASEIQKIKILIL